jgi:hypothetical protein
VRRRKEKMLKANKQEKRKSKMLKLKYNNNFRLQLFCCCCCVEQKEVNRKDSIQRNKKQGN